EAEVNAFVADLLRVTTHSGTVDAAPTGQTLSFTVLGNDRPGIVRDVTSAVSAHALSIESFTSRTLDAPMAGGTLFEATITVRVPETGDATPIVTALERLADEIQVDLSVG
ncbi:MAG: ACT domain-containing protein, partial [Microbacterium sp.]